MILDKLTGDLIIDKNHIIKAGMSVEEIKNSNIKDLLTEESKTELEAQSHSHLSLKTIVVDEIDVDLEMITLNNKIIDIEFDVDDAARKCHFHHDYNEFGKLVEEHKAFMRKMFDVKYIVDKIRFQGGYAQLRSETRSPSVNITISYYIKDEVK